MEIRTKVVFMGGKQAGCVGLLTLIAANCEVISVVAYDDIMGMVADSLGIRVFKSIKETGFIDSLRKSDLLFSVHGREIVSNKMLSVPPLGCVNVHPCLYKYKGANPIQKMLNDNNSKASVGVHYMIEKVDVGKVIVEEFVGVAGENVVEVYNELYPHYIKAILKAIPIIKRCHQQEAMNK